MCSLWKVFFIECVLSVSNEHLPQNGEDSEGAPRALGYLNADQALLVPQGLILWAMMPVYTCTYTYRVMMLIYAYVCIYTYVCIYI